MPQLSLNDALLVVTDLDGTLLDPHTHEWEAAQSWLTQLVNHQIPVVLSSSKTSAEIITMQQEMGLTGLPFIAENGAVIQLDESWSDDPHFPRMRCGTDHEAILIVIEKLRQQHGYKLFSFDDVDDKNIAEWTGLSPKMAAMARLLEASQTLIWRDTDERLAAFEKQLNETGLVLQEGGRFWHVLDAQCSKGEAINWLKSQYQQREGKRRVTLGLGDGPNDASLLDNVDYAVVVKGLSRHGVILKHDDPQRVYRTQAAGPEGWREGLDHFIGRE